MNTDNKYPNADTSAERLAEIASQELVQVLQKHPNSVNALRNHEAASNQTLAKYDLLAMLQERAEHVAIIELDLQKVATELHDQRWRRFGEQMPERFPIQVQFDGDNPPMHIYSMSSLPQVYINGAYWRPIPPLPKE